MTWWNYLLLVNVYLLLFYGFYALLLRKETFFQLNRAYLIIASTLSFFIPVIQSDWVKDLFITREVQLTIYNAPLVIYQFKPIQHTQMTIGDILAAVYLVGMIFLTGRFAWQMIMLNRVMKQGQTQVTFSFFKKIRLAPGQEDNHVIEAHEQVHASQWHSIDVLLIEGVMIINWFNPIVYLYRYAIKHIHEYIADRQAVKSGTNKTDYALLLLSQTFDAPAHNLVNPFYNRSLLRQRITMLQKNKSHRMALIKYGLSAPLFMLMLILSSATVYNSKTVGLVNKKVDQVLLVPATAPELMLDSVTITKPSESAINDEKLTIAEPTVTKKPESKTQVNPVFTWVEMAPAFKGGMDAFSRYLAKNVHYPAAMREAGIQGRVIISFIVEKDGSITNAHIARGVAEEIDQEALRVIRNSPRWTPGVQNGRPVRVAYSVPISFSLIEDPVEIQGDAPVIINRPSPADADAGNTQTDSVRKGAGIKVRGSQAPLYMVDGKQVSNLSSVDPKSIESVVVVKGKQGTALFGDKGANGALVVTTKGNQVKEPGFMSSAKMSEMRN
ncbi:MAG TPA: TonB family protein [Mucilaginibacter sp.]|nr:TonB family protein [Mucilaginibacter sp.]